jgi:hypothetical protein
MINSFTKVCAKVVANFYVKVVRHKKRPKEEAENRDEKASDDSHHGE